MSIYKVNALILKRIPLGEKDKIVTLFSREFGKIDAVAKGARKPTSKLAGASEPLVLLKATVAEGKSLDVLSDVEVRETFSLLKSDYGRYLRATYACDLLDKVTEPRDPFPEGFDLLLSTLYVLQRAPQPDTALHAFELKLTACIGYEPQLHACIRCELFFEKSNPPVAFSAARGGALCESCAGFVGDEADYCQPLTILTMERLMAVRDVYTLAATEVPEEIVAEMNRLLRAHLRLRVERKVKSTEFLDVLRLEETFAESAPTE